MKRWALLMAVPWLIDYTPEGKYEVVTSTPFSVGAGESYICPYAKNVCDDEAQALNDAHSRRTSDCLDNCFKKRCAMEHGLGCEVTADECGCR